jgi:hypothetical protein
MNFGKVWFVGWVYLAKVICSSGTVVFTFMEENSDKLLDKNISL